MKIKTPNIKNKIVLNKKNTMSSNKLKEEIENDYYEIGFESKIYKIPKKSLKEFERQAELKGRIEQEKEELYKSIRELRELIKDITLQRNLLLRDRRSYKIELNKLKVKK